MVGTVAQVEMEGMLAQAATVGMVINMVGCREIMVVLVVIGCQEIEEMEESMPGAGLEVKVGQEARVEEMGEMVEVVEKAVTAVAMGLVEMVGMEVTEVVGGKTVAPMVQMVPRGQEDRF